MASQTDLNSLQTLDDVRLYLRETTERLALLEEELHTLAKADDGDDELLKQMDIFDLLPGKLRPSLAEAQRLEEKLTRSAALASSASFKVKELDRVRERVREASNRVEDAMEGNRCVSGVSLALAKNDVEGAAEFIGRYKKLELEPSEPLEKAAHQVRDALSTQLASAEAAALTSEDGRILHEVSRLASLLAAIGSERQARSSYCSWVRRRLEQTSRTRRLLAEKDMESALQEAKKLTLCASALSDLFEGAAGELTNRLPEAIEALSEAVGASVVYAVEDGVGGDAAKMIEAYRSICDLKALSSGSKTSLTKAEEAKLAYLDSAALICSRIFLWKRFCDNKLQVQEKHHESFNMDSSGGKRALESQVQEVVAEYVGLEERFLLSSVQKAIEMEEPDPEAQASSMVDYVFFVLQKGAHRAISTLSSDGACAVLNIVISCLDSFLDVQQQMVQSSASTAYAPDVAGQVSYARALNSLSLSADFVVRLRNELENSIKKHFAGNLQDITKVETIFGEFAQMSSKFRSAVSQNLQLVVKSLEPSLRDIAEELHGDRVLTEKDYSAAQLDEASWPTVMQKDLDRLMVPFRRHMLPSCYDVLSRSIASSVAQKLERALLQMKFNALGALLLSRNVSAFAQHLTVLCPQARSDVARLKQMTDVLMVEECAEVEDLAAGPQWRLTPGETRRLLARRVEFSQHDVASVKL